MMKRLIIGMTLVFSYTSAYAGCDTCIQASVNTANSQITAGVNQATASVQANVSATQALNASIQATDAAWQAVIKLNSQQYLQALDAATNRVELTQTQLLKVEESLANHEVNSIAQVFKELFNAQQVMETERMLRPEIAQTLAGDIGANRAPLLKQGVVQMDQLRTTMDENFSEWNTGALTVNKSGQAITTSMLLTEDESVFDPTLLLSSSVVSGAESLDLQKLITLLINPSPEKVVSDDALSSDPNAEGVELERTLKNAKLSIAHSVFSKSLSEREAVIPISADDWQMGYVLAKPNAVGKTSYREFLESETVGRMVSEGWYEDVKTKTDAGVLREQVYQQAITNHLLYRSMEQDEQQLLLLSILAAQQTNNRNKRSENK